MKQSSSYFINRILVEVVHFRTDNAKNLYIWKSMRAINANKLNAGTSIFINILN